MTFSKAKASIDVKMSSMKFADSGVRFFNRFQVLSTNVSGDEGDTIVAESPTKPIKSTFFEILPAEIRCLIWEAAEPGPRLVDVTTQWDVLTQKELLPIQVCGSQHRIQSRAKQPITLSICHESRAETLRRYKLFFKLPNVIYINPSIDTLDLKASLFKWPNVIPCLVSMRNKSEIQNVMITAYGEETASTIDGDWYGNGQGKALAEVILIFDGLKTIQIRYVARYSGRLSKWVGQERLDTFNMGIFYYKALRRTTERKQRVWGWSLPEVSLFEGPRDPKT